MGVPVVVDVALGEGVGVGLGVTLGCVAAGEATSPRPGLGELTMAGSLRGATVGVAPTVAVGVGGAAASAGATLSSSDPNAASSDRRIGTYNQIARLPENDPDQFFVSSEQGWDLWWRDVW